MSVATTHKDYSQEWYTPDDWMAWVKETLVLDIFDPCSPGASGGLDCKWEFPCYVNHPGGRGQTKLWWEKLLTEWNWRHQDLDSGFIWCAFNIEQLRHMDPSPLTMCGFLVLPLKRIAFVDGSGHRRKSPSNWAVFWSTRYPEPTPEPSIVLPTGHGGYL